jgi:hypothetical protein
MENSNHYATIKLSHYCEIMTQVKQLNKYLSVNTGDKKAELS